MTQPRNENKTIIGGILELLSVVRRVAEELQEAYAGVAFESERWQTSGSGDTDDKQEKCRMSSAFDSGSTERSSFATTPLGLTCGNMNADPAPRSSFSYIADRSRSLQGGSRQHSLLLTMAEKDGQDDPSKKGNMEELDTTEQTKELQKKVELGIVLATWAAIFSQFIGDPRWEMFSKSSTDWSTSCFGKI